MFVSKDSRVPRMLIKLTECPQEMRDDPSVGSVMVDRVPGSERC